MDLLTVHVTEDLKLRLHQLIFEEWGDGAMAQRVLRVPAGNYLVDPEDVQERVAEDPTNEEPLVTLVASLDYFGILEMTSTPYPSE